MNEVRAYVGSPPESLPRYAPPMSGRGNTLDDFPAEAFAILAFCDACGRSRPLERAALAAQIDPGNRAAGRFG
jgi:hypothetical protein